MSNRRHDEHGPVGPQVLAPLALALVLLTPLAVRAQDAAPPVPPTLIEAEAKLEQAENLDAKKYLPTGYRDLEKRLEDAREQGVTAAEAERLLDQARRLLGQAAFVRECRDSRSTVEAMAEHFDRTLRQVAALTGVELDRGLAGLEAARQLLDHLEAERLEQQVRVDSLRVTVRRLQQAAGGAAGQDSLVTALRTEVSALRRRLWETELRAGVAEADRSAAETALTQRQQQEQAVREIRSDLGEENGQVRLTPEGAILLQVSGLSFAVGSAQLKPGQSDLLDRVAAAIRRFPRAEIRVEGHTDDTGSRAANLRLSQERADQVAAELAARLDRPVEELLTAGYGPDRPIAPNSTAEGRARNRRIDVVIIPPGASAP